MPAALKRNNESLYGESTRHVFYVATSDLLHLLTTYGYWARGAIPAYRWVAFGDPKS